MTLENPQLSPLEGALNSLSLPVGPSLLNKLRQKALKRYQQLGGLPESNKRSPYRYFLLSKLYQEPLELATPPKQLPFEVLEHSRNRKERILHWFQDGLFFESSDEGTPRTLVAGPLSKLFATYQTLVRGRTEGFINAESDPFVLLNSAFHHETGFFYLPPEEAPLFARIILHHTSESSSQLLLPRFQIVIGRNSALHLAIEHRGEISEKSACHLVADILLEENSTLTLCETEPASLSSNGWLATHLRLTQKAGSHSHLLSLGGGGRGRHYDYQVGLVGEKASTSLMGLSLLKGRERLHHQVFIDHQTECCSSRQLFKTALWQQSFSSFSGKIRVAKEAQETDAFQLNKTLLMSPEAFAATSPNLEIFADRVKASHGATTGSLEEGELFYLQTRGIGREQAEELLIRAFLEEVVEEAAREGIPLDCVNERLLALEVSARGVGDGSLL